MNKEKLLSIINKYVGYAEQEIYDAVAEYEEEKISFAKKHCEAALKAKIEAMEEYMNDGYDLEEIDSFTHNAYPLNNIK
jgi:nucleoid DNA-binding protein